MRTNLVLLAGRGVRFAEAGFKTPKPLIEVDGVPMVIAATRHLPPADKLVFVVSGDYIKNFDIDNTLKTYYPDAVIVTQTDGLRGQAHSALQAASVIERNSILNITSCDADPIYDLTKYEDLLADTEVDSLTWSFRNYPPMAVNPTAYGWIDTTDTGSIKKVQYKVPLSEAPLKDHAVVGWFTYRNAGQCFDNIRYMIEHNLKNGVEFSLDECTNVLLKNGLNVKIFEIDVFKSWGTPVELKTYIYWQKYFSSR